MTALSKLALKQLWVARFKPTSANFADLIDSWLDYQAALESGRNQVSAGATGIMRFVDSTTVAFTEITATGQALLSAANATAARAVLGAGAVGDIVFRATTTAGALSALGGGAVGTQLFSTGTTASAVAIFGTLGLAAATTAQAVTPVSADSAITPLIARYHPDLPKAWGMVEATSASTQILKNVRNITSVSLIATGLYNVRFTQAMASAEYWVMAQMQYGNTLRFTQINTAATVTAGGFQIYVTDAGATPANAISGTHIYFEVRGALA